MASPSPEPPSPLVEKNGSKTRRRTASDMPRPVSVTAMTTVPGGSSRVAIDRVPPSGIASMALRIRLVITSVSAAGRPWMAGTGPRLSRRSSGRFSWATFSSQRGRTMATASWTIWLTSTPTNCSSGRSRANCWMRRTVSEPSMAADSSTLRERFTSSASPRFCFISCV